MQAKLKTHNFDAKLNSMLNGVYSATRFGWRMWFIVLAIVLAIQLLTIDVLPHLQQDEAQITDYGRLALDPQSDWSITWWMAEGKPLLLWSYLGPLIAEISFQFAGPSGLGPRIASLIGGLVAATMALGWLISRKVPVYAAFGLSLAFLLDPLFVLSQRMARLDSWVIACCLAACWILHTEIKKDSNSSPRWRTMAAGGLAATAAFIWPSAIFMYPLLALELIQFPKSDKTAVDKWKSVFRQGVNFVIGGIIVVFLLMLPVWENMQIIFSDMETMVTQNVDSSKSFSDKLFGLFNIQNWLKTIKVFIKTFSPLLPLLAIFGVLIKREQGLIIATVATVILIFATLVYEFRVLYLIPYFIALSSSIFMRSEEYFPNPGLKNFAHAALGILIIWSVGIALVRTTLGLEAKTELDRERIHQVASSSIGPGNHKVFLGFTYEFYFVGRSLGWQLYTPYIQFTYDSQGNWIRENDYQPKEKFLNLLSGMDYAVFSKGSVNKDLEEQLNSSGLYFSKILRVGDDPAVKEIPQTHFRNIMLWFLQGKESYGSYVLFARQENGRSEDLSRIKFQSQKLNYLEKIYRNPKNGVIQN